MANGWGFRVRLEQAILEHPDYIDGCGLTHQEAVEAFLDVLRDPSNRADLMAWMKYEELLVQEAWLDDSVRHHKGYTDHGRLFFVEEEGWDRAIPLFRMTVPEGTLHE